MIAKRGQGAGWAVAAGATHILVIPVPAALQQMPLMPAWSQELHGSSRGQCSP
jgi:hypothetical protein